MSDKDAEPVGELHVEREGASVVVRIDPDDGEEKRVYLDPGGALSAAIWLQEAANDADRYASENAGEDGMAEESDE